MDRQTSATINGTKTSTKYDELGRPVSTWQGEADTGTKLSVIKYDTVAKGEVYGTYTYKDGAVYSSVINAVLDETNDYKPTSTKYTLSKTAEPQLGGTYEFTTQYNKDGTVQGQGLPAAADLTGESLGYQYDDLQRPAGLKTSLGGLSYVSSVTYSPTSNLETMELFTGGSTDKKAWLNYNYEQGTDRLKNSSFRVEGNTTAAYDADYTYDATGNILSIADTPSSGTRDVQCYTYDGLRRLTSAWTSSATPNGASGTGSTDAACAAGASSTTVGGVAPYWTEYGFDSIGNRTSEVRHGLNGAGTATRTYKYGQGSGPNGANSGPHTVSSVVEKTTATSTTPEVTSQDTYTYDATGNTHTRVLSGDTQTLDWDKQNKLTQVTNADGTATSYTYDATGARLMRKTSKESTFYLPGMELHLDKATSKVTATRYYTFGSTTVAMRDVTGVHFLASDHQGTAEMSADAKTGVTSRRRMDPFGNTRDDSSSSPSGWVNDKGFVGGTVQASTGLTTLGAREYDSDTGRFISADPIVDYNDPQQINGYAYANNSPISFSDASGLRMADCVGGWNECGPGPKKHPGAVADTVDYGASYTPAQQKADEARAKEDAAKARAIAIAKELASIIADELGITDALDCFTTGNIGACGSTVANVVGSLIGGGPLARLASKYVFRWTKAAAVAKRIVGLGKKLWKEFKGWRKSEKAAAEAEGVAASCNSFVPGTLVLMADGSTKKIEDVDIGDKVVATDPETGKTKTETVTAEIKGTGLKHLVKVTVDTDGKKGTKTASVTATDGHPFWVPELGAWFQATDLKPGEWLSTSTGTRVRIEAVKRWTVLTATVHNLTVSDLHTYYVEAGDTPLLVHNAKYGTAGELCKVRPGFKPKEGRGGKAGTRAGQNFTPAGKDEVIQRNALGHEDGIARCVNPNCDVELVYPAKSMKDVTPPTNEAQVDHVDAEADGGSGDPSNGQATCRVCNRLKSDGPQPW